jgi:hypothetical protein
MNQALDLLLQYKDYILVAIVVILLAIIAGKKNVKAFVHNNLKTLETDIIKNIAKNPTIYAQIIYGKLPVGLKAFATISTIEKIVAKFLDK